MNLQVVDGGGEDAAESCGSQHASEIASPDGQLHTGYFTGFESDFGSGGRCSLDGGTIPFIRRYVTMFP